MAPESDALAFAVARNYAKLLAYKDEYEVARLLTDLTFEQELKERFEDGAKLAFNMAPPFLPGKGPNGRPRKREFAYPWTRPLLGVLARMKGLRGTAFDLFGKSSERRMERALIVEYEELVEEVIGTVKPKNHKQAVSLLGLANMVRGYGPVKEGAVVAYGKKLEEIRAAYISAAIPRGNTA